MNGPTSENATICEVAHGSSAYWDTITLRNKVLREPLGLRFSAEELEAEATSYHVACYRDDRLVGCLVLRPLEDGEVRMRQVAVLPESQRQGIGTALVWYAEALARKMGYRRMVLHARESAVPFYEQLGYIRFGDPFGEVTIPHWVMEKRLTE